MHLFQTLGLLINAAGMLLFIALFYYTAKLTYVPYAMRLAISQQQAQAAQIKSGMPSPRSAPGSRVNSVREKSGKERRSFNTRL